MTLKPTIEFIKDGACRLHITYGFSEEEALELSAIEAGYESYTEAKIQQEESVDH